MHYLETRSKDQSKPEQTISRLVEALPGITEDLDLEEGPYVVLGKFAILLRNGIASGELSAVKLKETFEFLNELGESENTEIQNQLVVGIFEIMTDTPESIATCRAGLTGQSLTLFERTLASWNNA